MAEKEGETRPDRRRLRVGVILGGRSGEHDVSLMSASSVISALNPDKYEVVMIGITKEGRWLTGDVAKALESGLEDVGRPVTLLPDPQSSGLLELEMIKTRQTSLKAVTELDLIIPVLHGPYGEDGTMQGLLELAGLPYVGAGVVGSAVGMDKAIFKSVMTAHGIPLLPWSLVLRSEWKQDKDAILDRLEMALNYPMFTKPANLGSSVGISKCNDRAELDEGLQQAARYDRRLVVEQGINGRELEVSVLGNDKPIASIVGEIRPRREFYDYIAKYMLDPGSEEESELIIPADLEAELADTIRDLAVKAFRAIDCAGMARADFLQDRDNGQVFINELNTIPGFTRISMYPKLWEASGLPYPELLDRLIELALERFETKADLETTYESRAESQ
ncbi:MAG: D-alanine--D-alanine ligase family protein [Candidatus Promineifilaceae bacterium]